MTAAGGSILLFATSSDHRDGEHPYRRWCPHFTNHKGHEVTRNRNSCFLRAPLCPSWLIQETDESETHEIDAAHAAISSAISSISFTSLSLRRSSPARITPFACRALRAPTIAPVTAGLRSVQAIATSPGERPWRFPISRSFSTNSRGRERRGSWKSRWLLRQSSFGSFGARSRVIAPGGRPDAHGE